MNEPPERQERPTSAEPPKTPVIEYAQAPKRTLPVVGQFFLGIGATFGYGLFAWITLAFTPRSPALLALGCLHPILFLALVIYVRTKYQSRGFLAGVLTTILGIPLAVLLCSLVVPMR